VVPTVVEASKGDGGRVAMLAGIAARRVQRLVADGRFKDDNPQGALVMRRGQSTPLIAVTGGGLLARRQQRQWEDPATKTSKRLVGSQGRGGDDDDNVDPRGDDDDDTTISLAMAMAMRVAGDKEGDGGKSDGEGERRQRQWQ
jgi:hypothetical protein